MRLSLLSWPVWSSLIIFIAILFTVILLVDITSTEIEYSEIKHEKIKVVDVVYTPATHGSGSALGFTTDGNFTFSNISVGTQATYAVILQCVHGKFILKDSSLWANVNKGDEGICNYNEQFLVKRKDNIICEPPRLQKYNTLSIEINGKCIKHESH